MALERLIQRISVELGLDHLEVIGRNLVPAAKMPYRAAGGSLYDSGDYPRAVIGDGSLDDLKRRRDAARAAGRKYSIGFAAVVEPAMSNMGCVSRVSPVQTATRNCTRDGGGPFGFGNQVLISSHRIISTHRNDFMIGLALRTPSPIALLTATNPSEDKDFQLLWRLGMERTEARTTVALSTANQPSSL